MRAVAVRKLHGVPECMDLPVPDPGVKELQVRVEAAGVNPLDWKIIDGLYERTRRHLFPLVLGTDGAGVVTSLGPEARSFRVGDRVFGQFLHDPVGTGTYAESTVVPEGIGIARIPAAWSSEDAAALPTAGMMALASLEEVGTSPDGPVLVIGASGGVGSFATALGVGQGRRMIAATRKEGFERARALGAQEILDVDAPDPAAAMKQIHPNGVFAMIDTVPGEELFTRFVSLVRPGGIAISTTYSTPNVPASAVGPRRVSLSLEPSPELLERLVTLMERRQLKAPVEHRIALEQAPEALRESREGRMRGKTVIRIASRG